MPPTRAVRRRRQSPSRKSSIKTPTSPNSDSTPSTTALHFLFAHLKEPLFALLRALHLGLIGLLCAASLTHDAAALLLFMVSIGGMLGALLLVFISILRAPDNTPLSLPPVYHPDGSVVHADPLTVQEHDKKIATHYASELPALAIATAWVYAWVAFRPIILVFAVYLAYRLAYHPLFRIHLWKEPHCPDFERPFGGVPLFPRTDRESTVSVVEGKAQFAQALRDAGSKLVVVDFSATWCAPCRAIAPVFKDLAGEFRESAVFLSVDVDHSRDVAHEEAISSIPTFVFFRESGRLEMMRGATPPKLRETIQRHI